MAAIFTELNQSNQRTVAKIHELIGSVRGEQGAQAAELEARERANQARYNELLAQLQHQQNLVRGRRQVEVEDIDKSIEAGAKLRELWEKLSRDAAGYGGLGAIVPQRILPVAIGGDVPAVGHVQLLN